MADTAIHGDNASDLFVRRTCSSAMHMFVLLLAIAVVASFCIPATATLCGSSHLETPTLILTVTLVCTTKLASDLPFAARLRLGPPWAAE